MPERGTQYPLPEKGVQTPDYWPPPLPTASVPFGGKYRNPLRPTLRVSALSPVQECSEPEETPRRNSRRRRRGGKQRSSAAKEACGAEQTRAKTRPRRRKGKPKPQAPLDETYETVPFDETYSVTSESGTDQTVTKTGDTEEEGTTDRPSEAPLAETSQESDAQSMPKPQRTRVRRSRQKKRSETVENPNERKEADQEEETTRDETPMASPEDVKGVKDDTSRTERSGRRLFSESSTGSTEHRDDSTQDEETTGGRKKSGKDRRRLLFEQKYGYFHCHNCDWRWESAYVWCVAGTDKVYFRQDCRLCQNAINPYFVEDLYCGRCRCSPCTCPRRRLAETNAQYNQGDLDSRKQHRRELCHRCRDKPIPCNAIPSFKYQV